MTYLVEKINFVVVLEVVLERKGLVALLALEGAFASMDGLDVALEAPVG